MRYALVSDLHANWWAWQATLAALEDLDIDQIICLGDVIGYGSRPVEVLDSLREHATATVIGNHDAVVAGLFDSSVFNDRAREVIEWTAAQMSPEQAAWLAELPAWWQPKDKSFLAVHAEVVDPGRFDYISDEAQAAANFAACDSQLVFFGHTHFPTVFVLQESGEILTCKAENFTLQPGQRYLINPGTVGDPRVPEVTARFAIFDSASAAISFHHADFDIAACRQDVATSGLPQRQAFLRLIDGETRPIDLLDSDFRPDDTRRITLKTPLPSQPKLAARPLTIASAKPGQAGTQTRVAAAKPQHSSALVWTLSSLGLLLLGGLLIFTLSATQKPGADVNQRPNPALTQQSPRSQAQVNAQSATPAAGRPIARFVRIELPSGEILSLAEVQVWSGFTNIAPAGRAEQSTSHSSGKAERAIDGNTDGTFSHGSVTHTNANAKGTQHWQVDLGREFPIDRVVVFNRQEAEDPEVSQRLAGFQLLLLDENREVVAQFQDKPPAAAIIRFEFNQE